MFVLLLECLQNGEFFFPISRIRALSFIHISIRLRHPAQLSPSNQWKQKGKRLVSLTSENSL